MKKGITKIIGLIFALPILILITMFATIGLYEIGDDFIIKQIHNATKTTAQDLNFTSTQINIIDNANSNYDNISFPYDILIILMCISAFVGSAIASITSPKLPEFNFLGMVVFGTMMLLVVIFFLNQFIDWYLQEFFYKLFDDLTIQTPFIDWLFDDNNLSIILVVWFAILLFLNQLDENIKDKFKSNKNNNIDGGRFEE